MTKSEKGFWSPFNTPIIKSIAMNLLFSFLLATIVATVSTVEQTASLPDEFTLKMDFKSGWPFVENCCKPNDQNLAKGDTYTYLYSFESEDGVASEEFDFVIYGNKTNYHYLKGSNSDVRFLQPNPKSATTRITLPSVPGRYLKSVTLKVANNYGKRFQVVDTKTWKVLQVSDGATNDTPATVVFASDDVVTQVNQPYYLRLIDTGTLVTGITLVYSSSL